MDTVNITWNEKMSFTNEIEGHIIITDTFPENGGENLGPRPKPLILSALGSCTAMDVISILKKMRNEPSSFIVTVDGKLTEEHPKQYYEITLTFKIDGENIPAENVKKAVSLSEDRYCGVSAMLKKALTINTVIVINGVEI